MTAVDSSRGPSSIAEVIAAEGGRVTFARFMELALTHPTLGYYTRADRLLSRRGDFSTAPALSPFFNQTLARLVTELVDASLASDGGEPSRPPRSSPDEEPVGAEAAGASVTSLARRSVVELGGGEGHFAQSLLEYWERERPEFRQRLSYRIVEVGGLLRERQVAALAAFTESGWDVAWGQDLVEACTGTSPVLMVGNEFLDALPVHVLDLRMNELRELYVRPGDGDSLNESWEEPSSATLAETQCLFGTLEPAGLLPLTEDGVLEVSGGLGDFMTQAAALLPSGSLLMVDYGEWFPGVCGGEPVSRRDARWQMEQRLKRRRSIRGYFKHQLVADPLARPGRQDLTADVDFAALDFHGGRYGFETVLFTTLACLLRGGGAEAELQALAAGTALAGEAALGADRVEAAPDPLEADRQATVLKDLLDEQDLGAAFKVMLQVRE